MTEPPYERYAPYPAEFQALVAAVLVGIAHRCARETGRFFQRLSHDPRYCFELFRRSTVDCNQRAWALVYALYGPLVAGWAKRHPAMPTSGEEALEFVEAHGGF